MKGRIVTAVVLSAVLAGAVRAAGVTEEGPREEAAPVVQVRPGGVQPLLPDLWQSRAAITWKLDRGGIWASLGHSATVFTIRPEGGTIVMTAWKVESFDAATRAPAKAEPILEKTFGAADLAAVKGRLLAHTFHVPGDTFRYCLMLKMPFTLSADGKALASASPRVAVIEFLDDKGTVPHTSKWIEATNAPDASWAAREAVKAPWTDGRPWAGTFEMTAQGPRFGAAAPRVVDAPEAQGPKLGSNPDVEGGDAAADLEEKAEK